MRPGTGADPWDILRKPAQWLWKKREAKLRHGSVARKRMEALYRADKDLPIRKSHQNPAIKQLYAEFLGEPGSHVAHTLLHTTYVKRGK